jgi:hypothetical protein
MASAVRVLLMMKASMFQTAYAQDLNPPTTGRTSPNVTSSFGLNMPAGPNASRIASNTSQGAISTSTVPG